MTTRNAVTNTILAAGIALYVGGLATKIYCDPRIFPGAEYKASLTETQRNNYKEYADYGTAANIASFFPLMVSIARKMK